MRDPARDVDDFRRTLGRMGQVQTALLNDDLAGRSANRDHSVTQREVAASDANPALAQMHGDSQLARFETAIEFNRRRDRNRHVQVCQEC
jgi:hypothetical protein